MSDLENKVKAYNEKLALIKELKAETDSIKKELISSADFGEEKKVKLTNSCSITKIITSKGSAKTEELSKILVELIDLALIDDFKVAPTVSVKIDLFNNLLDMVKASKNMEMYEKLLNAVEIKNSTSYRISWV